MVVNGSVAGIPVGTVVLARGSVVNIPVDTVVVVAVQLPIQYMQYWWGCWYSSKDSRGSCVVDIPVVVVVSDNCDIPVEGSSGSGGLVANRLSSRVVVAV